MTAEEQEWGRVWGILPKALQLRFFSICVDRAQGKGLCCGRNWSDGVCIRHRDTILRFRHHIPPFLCAARAASKTTSESYFGIWVPLGRCVVNSMVRAVDQLSPKTVPSEKKGKEKNSMYHKTELVGSTHLKKSNGDI